MEVARPQDRHDRPTCLRAAAGTGHGFPRPWPGEIEVIHATTGCQMILVRPRDARFACISRTVVEEWRALGANPQPGRLKITRTPFERDRMESTALPAE